jgi:hypothetical protein
MNMSDFRSGPPCEQVCARSKTPVASRDPGHPPLVLVDIAERWRIPTTSPLTLVSVFDVRISESAR